MGMLVRIARRALALVPVLLIVAIVTFSLVHLMPGDAARTMLGVEATPEQVEALRHEMGLDQPALTQFFTWLGDALRGDLGTSVFLGKPVTEALGAALAPTVNLAILAQLIAIVIGIPAGIAAARRQGGVADSSIMMAAMAGISVPSFLLALLLMLVFAVGLQLFPVAGYSPPENGLLETLRHLALPGIALGTMQAALLARMTRSVMLDELSKPYMKTTKAFGVRHGRAVYRYALPNASLPIITTIGQSLGGLFAGAAVVEVVFGIPGLGQLLVNSIERRDLLIIQGVVLLTAVVYVLVNFLVDVIYTVVDPRVRVS